MDSLFCQPQALLKPEKVFSQSQWILVLICSFTIKMPHGSVYSIMKSFTWNLKCTMYSNIIILLIRYRDCKCLLKRFENQRKEKFVMKTRENETLTMSKEDANMGSFSIFLTLHDYDTSILTWCRPT